MAEERTMPAMGRDALFELLNKMEAWQRTPRCPACSPTIAAIFLEPALTSDDNGWQTG